MNKQQSRFGEKILSFVRMLGPGIITAALVFGPGSLTVASKLGANYQYKLLWIVIVSTFFMVIFTMMSTKIGISTDQTLIGIIKKKYGKVYSVVIGIGIFMVTVLFQSGNSIGAGLAFAGLSHTSPVPWILFFSAFAISFLFLRSFYKILEKIMIAMVVIMLLSFLFTLIISAPDYTEMFQGFVPGIPKGSEMLSIALIATSFSIVGAFYQSYLVQERGWDKESYHLCRRETLTGILLLGFITMMVISAAGSVLFPRGIKVQSAADMGEAIRPLFGNISSTVFMIGLFAASFSSLIGNATLGGSVLADTLSIGNKLQDLPLRLMIMLIIVTGAAIAIIFSDMGLQLIVLAQRLTILIVPFIAFFILLVSNNESLMGPLKNNRFHKIAGMLGLLLLLVLAFNNLYHLFIK
jgi:Mn2+/Fe2+ NRAMP family transporter